MPPSGVSALADSTGTVKPAAEPTVTELVDRANKALRGDSSHGQLTMTIVTPKLGAAHMDVEGWNKAARLRLHRHPRPGQGKGDITLRRKNEMWLWITNVEQHDQNSAER